MLPSCNNVTQTAGDRKWLTATSQQSKYMFSSLYSLQAQKLTSEAEFFLLSHCLLASFASPIIF